MMRIRIHHTVFTRTSDRNIEIYRHISLVQYTYLIIALDLREVPLRDLVQPPGAPVLLTGAATTRQLLIRHALKSYTAHLLLG